VNAQIRGETTFRGLQSPVAIVAHPTARGVFVIVEQGGLVRIVRDGEVHADPFLDLRDEISTGGERGLLGLAFAPDYAVSRRLFVNFTNRSGDTVVARYITEEQNPLAVADESRFDLQWRDGRRFIPQPFANHNGGHLAFGPDGYLYIGLGDGGSAGDPMNHAQHPQSLLGKMLRIDVNVDASDSRGYREPSDNPFAGNDPLGAFDEIWAFGFRNPWRYSFDDGTRGGTSALLVADVGQNSREEINFEPADRGGRNYGWRIREGRAPYDSRTPPAYLPLSEPIHDYGREQGRSITGGYVYRGAALDPAYQGRYFFADFVSGRVFSIGLHLDEAGEARADDEREHTSVLGGSSVLGTVSSFGQDSDGELLLVNYTAGTVVRILPDLAVVPGAPILNAEFESMRAHLSWLPAEGVPATGFIVERLRENRVVERLIVERREVALDAFEHDCFRVRGTAQNGASGPASAISCPN
jgi:glucose/arabinose dehydrogenase